MSLQLNADVEEWLRERNIICEFAKQMVAQDNGKPRLQVCLIFQNESDAVLFKLTWM